MGAAFLDVARRVTRLLRGAFAQENVNIDQDTAEQAGERLMITPRKIMPTNGEGAAATVEWGRLIEAVATRRDRAAFVRLFEHFAPRVKTFMLRSKASEATAEEIAQETMLTVWRKANSFVPGSTGAAAWIFTISRNLRIDALRRERRNGYEIDLDKDIGLEAHLDERTPESQVAAVELHKAMRRLSNEQLRVIELSFFGEKAHGEIAEQLQIPLGTVKSRSRRAITRLRALLGTCHGDRAPVAAKSNPARPNGWKPNVAAHAGRGKMRAASGTKAICKHLSIVVALT